MKKLVIITGTSRGLGFHLTKRFIKENWTVIGIARNNKIKNKSFHFLRLDLAKTKNITSQLNIFVKQKKLNQKYEQVVLINNAATVNPIDYVRKLKTEEILSSYLLNLHAPMILSQWLIQKYQGSAKQLLICNISSGAAQRPISNWSLYCTMKSGLKMFTECLHSEFGESNQLKAFNFYPGIMDTQMQQVIRGQSKAKFKLVNQFKDYKKRNLLRDPSQVSHVIFDLINSPEKIDKTEYNILNFDGLISNENQ